MTIINNNCKMEADNMAEVTTESWRWRLVGRTVNTEAGLTGLGTSQNGFMRHSMGVLCRRQHSTSGRVCGCSRLLAQSTKSVDRQVEVDSFGRTSFINWLLLLSRLQRENRQRVWKGHVLHWLDVIDQISFQLSSTCTSVGTTWLLNT